MKALTVPGDPIGDDKGRGNPFCCLLAPFFTKRNGEDDSSSSTVEESTLSSDNDNDERGLVVVDSPQSEPEQETMESSGLEFLEWAGAVSIGTSSKPINSEFKSGQAAIEFSLDWVGAISRGIQAPVELSVKEEVIAESSLKVRSKVIFYGAKTQGGETWTFTRDHDLPLPAEVSMTMERMLSESALYLGLIEFVRDEAAESFIAHPDAYRQPWICIACNRAVQTVHYVPGVPILGGGSGTDMPLVVVAAVPLCVKGSRQRRCREKAREFIKAKLDKYQASVCHNCCAAESNDGIELKKCRRCLAVSYCSKACQVAHHPLHKFVCSPCKDKTLVQINPMLAYVKSFEK